jgi:hypothetical protein
MNAQQQQQQQQYEYEYEDEQEQEHADQALIGRCLQGEVNCFGDLVLRYEPMIRTMIGRMIKEPDLVDELAHQAGPDCPEHSSRPPAQAAPDTQTSHPVHKQSGFGLRNGGAFAASQ